MPEELDELDLQMQREAARQSVAEGGTSNDPADDPAENHQQPPVTQQQEQQTQQQQNPAEKPTDTTQQQQAQQQTEAPNFDKYFEEISGGVFKSADEFKAALPKWQAVNTAEQQVADLQKKLNEAYADDYEKKRNELKRSGATKEQLKAFETVNDLGDLNELDPIEAKVQKLILVDGYSEKIARSKVDREFPLDTADEDELEELKEDLRLSVKKDLEALQAFKVQQSTPQTDKNLVTALQKQQIEAQINPVLTDFVNSFSSLGTLNLNGKEGDDAIGFNLDITAEAKQEIAGDIKAYFVDNQLPVTQENYNEALAYARDQYISKNIGEYGRAIWSKASSYYEKFYSDKYSNSSGLPKGDRKPSGGKTQADQEHEQWKRSELGVDLNSGY